jgi:hypothetical protein
MPAQTKAAKPTRPTAGIDIGKYAFHLFGLDKRGAIVFKAKQSRNQLMTRLANLPPCLIEKEAYVGTARPIQRSEVGVASS